MYRKGLIFLRYWFFSGAACIAIAILLGRDLNWDLHNYHFFAGYWAGREDFTRFVLPAGIQSYLFPYTHAPFFWLTEWGLPDILVAAGIAAVQGLNVVALIMVVRQIDGADALSSIERFFVYGLVICCPVFVVELGTSFVDAIVSIPVLFGLYFLLRCVTGKGEMGAVFAGFLLGFSVVLKLTNAAFLAAAFVAVLCAGGRARVSILCLTLLGAFLSLFAGWILWYGSVYHEFGNPVFPFFNGVFRSEFYPAESHSHSRFIPVGFLEFLLFPLEFVLPYSYLYTETRSPDLRVPALFLLLLVILLQFISSQRSQLFAKLKVQHAFVAVFFLVAWLLWAKGSGNGRYGLPILMLAGAMIPVVLALLVRRRFWRLAGLSSVLFMQSAVLLSVSELRWAPTKWTRDAWLEAQLPHELDKEPALVLSADPNSNSWLIPFMAHGSSFVTIVGSYPVGRDSALWRKVIPLEDRFSERTFLLYSPPARVQDSSMERVHHLANQFSAHAGYEVDTSSSCKKIVTRESISIEHGLAENMVIPVTYVCRIQRLDATSWMERERRKLQVERVFSSVQRMCPDVFRPSVSSVVGNSGTWYKYFVDRDLKLVYANDKIFVDSTIREAIFIGTSTEVLDGSAKIDCEKIKSRRWRLQPEEI